MQKKIHIRNLHTTDLSAIVDIEERLTGVRRPDYWKQRIEMSEAIRPHWASLIAEVDNRVTGFVFGRTGELEFGLPGKAAWIEVVGVDPAYKRQGIARALIEQLTESARDHGIKTIFTLVDHGRLEIEGFFTGLGFVQGKMLHFQRTLD